MTRDEIIRMAREAEFCDATELDLNVEWTCSFSELQHFANLVAAAEREACEDLCAEYPDPDRIAAAIRAREFA